MDATIRHILTESKTIAIVGASSNPERPSYEVAQYLQEHGYRIVPVNPALTELLGEKAYPDVAAIPFAVDVVDIFRTPDAVPAIVEQAIAKKARGVWMQLGAENPQAYEHATNAGLTAIMNTCMMREHKKLSG